MADCRRLRESPLPACVEESAWNAPGSQEIGVAARNGFLATDLPMACAGNSSADGLGAIFS
jgi:hypothetical protein